MNKLQLSQELIARNRCIEENDRKTDRVRFDIRYMKLIREGISELVTVAGGLHSGRRVEERAVLMTGSDLAVSDKYRPINRANHGTYCSSLPGAES